MFKTQKEIWEVLLRGEKVSSKINSNEYIHFKNGTLVSVTTDTEDPAFYCFNNPDDWEIWSPQKPLFTGTFLECFQKILELENNEKLL